MRFRIGDYVKVKGVPGIIRFIGNTEFAPGVWFGVELEKAIGKNDGSVKGVRYFKCQNNNGLYGVFVKEERLEDVHKGVENLDHSNIDNLQRQLKAALIENAQCKKELDILQNKLEAKLHSHEQLEAKLEMQSIDNQYLQEAKDILEGKLANLTARYQSLQHDYDSALEELELGRELENELRFIDVDALSPNEVKSLIEKGRLDEKRIRDLNERIQLQNEELSEKSDQLKASNTRLIDLSADLSSKNSVISHLKEKLDTFADLERMSEQLSIENGELLDKINSLEKSLDELNEIHALDAKIEADLQRNEQNLKDELGHLQNVIARDKERIRKLESQLGSSVTIITSSIKDTTPPDSQHEIALHTMEQKLMKAEQKYRSCALELQVCELRRKVDSERVKLHAISPLSQEYIDLVYDVKLQCGILDLLHGFAGHDEIYVFYKYATSRIGHFCQTVLHILEYNYAHEHSEKLASQSKAYTVRVQNLTEEIISILKDYSIEALSLDSTQDILKECQGLCDEYIAILNNDSEETPYFLEHNLLINHIEFSLAKFLNYLNSLTSSESESDNLSELIHSIKSIKSKFDKSFEQVLSESSSTNVLIKPSSSFANAISSITEVSNQLLGGKSLDVEKFDNLEKAFANIAESEVYTEQSSLTSIYEYEEEKPPVKETEPEKSTSDSDNTTEVILLKDKEISNLNLNIALLEQNMKLFTKKTTDQIQQLEKQLSVMKAEVQEKSTQIAKLQEENKSIRNQSLLHKINIDDIESQKAYDEKIKRMEKLIELRDRAAISSDCEDLSWLAFPNRSKVWKKPTQLQSLSHDIRKLANHTQFITIGSTEKSKWAPQRKTPRYINACINEKFSRYKSNKAELFMNGSS
ncbi:NIP100 [Candida metapsilosis]|uniref:NIP100 n=1 Tax=Candida metapsilosis TaxID=273372 RepID=A0A8H7ZF55_9ASCO|nr:NIP100 [Candida metapsilosis]